MGDAWVRDLTCAFLRALASARLTSSINNFYLSISFWGQLECRPSLRTLEFGLEVSISLSFFRCLEASFQCLTLCKPPNGRSGEQRPLMDIWATFKWQAYAFLLDDGFMRYPPILGPNSTFCSSPSIDINKLNSIKQHSSPPTPRPLQRP